MERPILQGCQGCCSFKKGTIITPEPNSWLSLADACQDVVTCLNSNGGTGKRLVVHFFLPGTQIRVDIGNVKAAGFLCVLGISVGIGTYVLYKIYDRFFRPGFRRKPSCSLSEDDEEEEELEIEDVCCILQKGEEGIMGNQQSSLADIPVYYKPGYGVSLYQPASDEPNLLRNRKIGQPLNGDRILKGNLVNKNGYNQALHLDGQLKEQANTNGKRKVPSLGELRIEIDESGFVEDDGLDQNNEKLSNSLKGNFSPTSLFEKNLLLSPVKTPADDTEVDSANQVQSMSECKTQLENHSNKDVNLSGNDGNKSVELSRLNLVTNLGASSVLLTPPSEDESSSSSQPFYSGSAQFSQHSTKTDVSDFHSEVIDQFVHDQSLAETDEDQEQMSPLPYDRSPHRTPEKHFKKKLLLKLHEVSHGSNQSSNNSSNCSTPDPNQVISKRTDSLSGEVENSISGVSSPDLELLHSENSTEAHREMAFEHLEDEIHGVEDEFETISQKIHELADKYANMDEEPGTEIINNIFTRYPSIRVRQQERQQERIVNPRVRLPSLSESDTQDVHSQSSDIDLSWDLENVLDMVYSEASDSSSMHSGPGPRAEKICDSKPEGQDSGLDVIMEVGSGCGSGSFTSNIDMEGSLYEDDFHIQLAGCKKENEADDTVETDGGAPESQVPDSITLASEMVPSMVCNVGPSQDIVQYAEAEWKGDTPRAKLMRKAYKEIPQHCQCCHLRRIRGDNYCGIRGAVFQLLVNHLPLNPIWSSKDEVLRELQRAYNDPVTGLRLWTFAGRVSFTPDNQIEVMAQCITSLFDRLGDMMDHNSYAERLEFITRLLNSDPESDLQLMEGVKLLMLLSAIRLHGDMLQGNDVPVFVWLMFARDTSEDLSDFVENHLNPVGNSGGLEQVEMFLLGYTLGVRIQVFRLQQYDQEDFLSYYPDDCHKDWSTISLIAEDDRHYNVPVL